MMFVALSGSAWRMCARSFTSTSAWWWNRFLLRISFNATSWFFLWSKQRTTCPNEPRPNTPSTS